jgi:hypothetical protein
MSQPKPAGVKLPTAKTLGQYGLTEAEWLAFCDACDFTCVVCGQPFGDRPLAIDHEHVKGFKATKKRKAKQKKAGATERHTIRVRVMSQAERRKYVRGVIHNYCNRFVRSWLTLTRAKAIVKYLEAYEAAKAAAGKE